MRSATDPLWFSWGRGALAAFDHLSGFFWGRSVPDRPEPAERAASCFLPRRGRRGPKPDLSLRGVPPRRTTKQSIWIPTATLSLLLFLLPLARAHDPYQSWAAGTLYADRLELNITMAQSTALRLVDPDRNIGGLTPEIFAKNRALFEREAAGLFIVTSGHTRLGVTKVSVELTEENDVAFKVTYPGPAPGRLHFRAAFLVKLGEGYGGILDISDAANKQINWDQLSGLNANFEIEVPKPAKPKK